MLFFWCCCYCWTFLSCTKFYEIIYRSNKYIYGKHVPHKKYMSRECGVWILYYSFKHYYYYYFLWKFVQSFTFGQCRVCISSFCFDKIGSRFPFQIFRFSQLVVLHWKRSILNQMKKKCLKNAASNHVFMSPIFCDSIWMKYHIFYSLFLMLMLFVKAGWFCCSMFVSHHGLCLQWFTTVWIKHCEERRYQSPLCSIWLDCCSFDRIKNKEQREIRCRERSIEV